MMLFQAIALRVVWVRLAVAVSVTVLSLSVSAARDYPTGTVRFITQLPAGSGTDPAMRIVIDELSKRWGEQAILVNQPGAGGAIAARTVATAAPDGSTLFMAIASTFFVLPELQPNLPFNVNDFVPIGFVGEVPLAIAVTSTSSADSLPDLIAMSRKIPGGVNFAVLVRGGLTHLAVELLKTKSDPNFTDIFYPGSAQAMSDVLSGWVPAIIDGLAGPIAKGELKMLAVTSHERVPQYASVPTVAETVPGFAATGWFALVAPPRTSPAIVKQLSEDLQAVLSDEQVKERLGRLSVLTRRMSPVELASFVHAEQSLWGPVIKRIGSEAR